jgi:hypothetical protein
MEGYKDAGVAALAVTIAAEVARVEAATVGQNQTWLHIARSQFDTALQGLDRSLVPITEVTLAPPLPYGVLVGATGAPVVPPTMAPPPPPHPDVQAVPPPEPHDPPSGIVPDPPVPPIPPEAPRVEHVPGSEEAA